MSEGVSDRREPDPLRLAELLAARLCHELAGPIGPMTGMLELAAEDPAAAEEALSAIGDSCAGLSARLKLLRACWSGDAAETDLASFAALATTALGRKRLSFDFAGMTPGPLTPVTARLLLNVLLLGAESLPLGGVVHSAGQPDGDIMIRLEGERAAWPQGLAAILANPDAAWGMLDDPRRVQLPFIAMLARRPGPRLSVLFGPSSPPPLLISHRDV